MIQRTEPVAVVACLLGNIETIVSVINVRGPHQKQVFSLIILFIQNVSLSQLRVYFGGMFLKWLKKVKSK